MMTHFKPLPVYGYESGPTSVPLPFSMLKTESKEAIAINKEASAKCLPGQVRFPNPNTDVNSGSSRKGSIWVDKPFRFEGFWLWVRDRVMKDRPTKRVRAK
jgi:hypothetical protein